MLPKIPKENSPENCEVEVFHGRKHWTLGSTVLAPAIEYQLGRGASMAEAQNYAKGLYQQLTDFGNASVLNVAMYNAQVSGVFSPFVSASRKREIARSFAMHDGQPGYVLKIKCAEDMFYDFNRVRDLHKIPHRPEFRWLEELGIPYELGPPFRIIRVEKVVRLEEKSVCVYEG